MTQVSTKVAMSSLCYWQHWHFDQSTRRKFCWM